VLTGKYRRGESGRAQSSISQFLHSEEDGNKAEILDVVEAVAREASATPEEVAIGWSMAKGIIPIIGPRTTDQLRTNLAAADLCLSPQQIARLDAVSTFPLGYPHEMLADPAAINMITGGNADLLDTPSHSVR